MGHLSAHARQRSASALIGSSLFAVSAGLGCQDSPPTTAMDISVGAPSSLSAVRTTIRSSMGDERPGLLSDKAQGQAQVQVILNHSPKVTAIASSPGPVAAGAPVVLHVAAFDADGDSLTYHWTGTCPGRFDQETRAETTFVPGALTATTDCAFTVEVSDDRGGSGMGTLYLPATQVMVEIAPAIGIASQSTDVAEPSEVVLLHVEANDPHGLRLTWTWSASDGTLSGQDDHSSSSEVRWTAPAATGTTCAITATATNEKGASASYVFKARVGGG